MSPLAEMVLAGGLFLLLNVAVLGMNLKLYTEILKDQSQNRRMERKNA